MAQVEGSGMAGVPEMERPVSMRVEVLSKPDAEQSMYKS
jgi:hypothetical protein